jgi:Flp pilus assembly protein TadD
MFRRAGLLLSVVLLSGLVPALTEEHWVDIRSPHFSVLTDGGEDRGREIALQFELMRSVFSQLFLRDHVNQSIPLQIVAFRNAEQISSFAPQFRGQPLTVAGFFQQGQDKNYIVLNLDANNSWPTVFHEYAHLLLHSNVAGLPPWFDEGFAEYFSTIKIGKKEAVLGGIPEYARGVLGQEELIPISELFTVGQSSPIYNDDRNHRTLFYAQSWLVVNYLFSNARLKDAIAYFKLVGEHVPMADAFQRAFHMDPATFDKGIADFYQNTGGRTITVGLPMGLEKVSFAGITVSQVGTLAILADLHLHEPDYQQQAVQEFKAVLKLDSENVIAHRGLGYGFLRSGEFDEAMAHFQKAAEKDSRDPMVHYYWAVLMAQKQEPSLWPQMEKEARLVTQLNPEMADGFALLGFALMSERQTDDAAKAYENALRLSPGNEGYAATLGDLYISKGRTENARSIFVGLQNSDRLLISTLARNRLQEMEANEQMADAADSAQPPKVASARGRLVHVDCTDSPRVKLTIMTNTGTLQLVTPDVAKAAKTSLSCGSQSRNVAVKYIGADENRLAELISLEIE